MGTSCSSLALLTHQAEADGANAAVLRPLITCRQGGRITIFHRSTVGTRPSSGRRTDESSRPSLYLVLPQRHACDEHNTTQPHDTPIPSLPSDLNSPAADPPPPSLMFVVNLVTRRAMATPRETLVSIGRSVPSPTTALERTFKKVTIKLSFHGARGLGHRGRVDVRQRTVIANYVAYRN